MKLFLKNFSIICLKNLCLQYSQPHIYISMTKTPDRPTKIFEDLGNSKLSIYQKEKKIEFVQLLNIHDYGQGSVNENQNPLI